MDMLLIILQYKTYVRDQDYSNRAMIIVLRYNIPTTVIYELYGRSRITTGLLYGSISTSILLDKVVWDKISGHT